MTVTKAALSFHYLHCLAWLKYLRWNIWQIHITVCNLLYDFQWNVWWVAEWGAWALSWVGILHISAPFMKIIGIGGYSPPLNGKNPLSSFWQRPLYPKSDWKCFEINAEHNWGNKSADCSNFLWYFDLQFRSACFETHKIYLQDNINYWDTQYEMSYNSHI